MEGWFVNSQGTIAGSSSPASAGDEEGKVGEVAIFGHPHTGLFYCALLCLAPEKTEASQTGPRKHLLAATCQVSPSVGLIKSPYPKLEG